MGIIICGNAEGAYLSVDTAVAGDRNGIKKEVDIRTLQLKYSPCEMYKQK